MATTGIGERIKEIRGDKTQEDFAGSIGISRSTLSRWENEASYPTHSGMLKICAIHKRNLAWLATGETSRNNPDQPDNLVIAAPEEHREDSREQIKPLQIAPQEVSGMPARTRNVFLCCALAIFFLVLLKISHDDFFKKLSVLAFLTCVFLGHYFLALPYIERWFCRAPKNLGM
jgi:transcriptional regulator with XRE-family HTH domain